MLNSSEGEGESGLNTHFYLTVDYATYATEKEK